MNIILVILAGISLTIMITLNGMLTAHLNIFEVSFIVHLIGMVLLAIYIKFIKNQSLNIWGAPLKLYISGILGVFLVTANSYSFNIVGVTLTVAFSLAGQIVVATIVDHFGLYGVKKVKFNMLRIPNFIIISLGLILMIRG